MSGKQTMLRVSFATSQWLKLTRYSCRMRPAGIGESIIPSHTASNRKRTQGSQTDVPAGCGRSTTTLDLKLSGCGT